MCLRLIHDANHNAMHASCRCGPVRTANDDAADVEVAQDAALVINGGDPQLEAAVAVVLEEIEKNPPPPPHALQPPEPVRSKL